MLVIKNVPVKGSCSSAHDKAEIYRALIEKGWTVLKVFEDHGRCYAMVQESK